MIYYDNISVSEEIDVDKTNESEVWSFLDKDFKLKTYVCNGCHI